MKIVGVLDAVLSLRIPYTCGNVVQSRMLVIIVVNDGLNKQMMKLIEREARVRDGVKFMVFDLVVPERHGTGQFVDETAVQCVEEPLAATFILGRSCGRVHHRDTYIIES